MNEGIRQIAPLLRLYEIKRWSMIPMDREQSVAEHSFSVIVIADALARLVAKKGVSVFIPDVITWAVLHDSEEYWTTDIPSPIKTALRETVGGLRGLDDLITKRCRETNDRYLETRLTLEGTVEAAIVKVADCVETLAYFVQHSVSSPAYDLHREYMTKALDKAEDYLVSLCDPILTKADLTYFTDEILSGGYVRNLARVRLGGPYELRPPEEEGKEDDGIPF